MSLNSTPRANRVHIGIFGRRNVGKSSLINRLTNQEISIVSDVEGTTTDPVFKAMELLPIGPVVFIDTAGIDDSGSLGELRTKKTYDILAKTDVALAVFESGKELTNQEKELLKILGERKIPFLIVVNKSEENASPENPHTINVNCITGKNINLLKESLGQLVKLSAVKKPLVSDLVSKDGLVVLVTPIDDSAPQGRLILPQQQVIRDLLDAHLKTMVVQPSELISTLELLKAPPQLVIADSQAIRAVSEMTPREIPLTTFSIVFARFKGILADSLNGISRISNLQDGDNILVSEGCSHHRQCGDIGRDKIPQWLMDYTEKDLSFTFTSGGEFPEDLTKYKLIVHCGGCTLNEREVSNRMHKAKEQKVPMTNYGLLISFVQKTLTRTLEPFEALKGRF